MATPLTEEEIKALLKENKFWSFVDSEGGMDYRTMLAHVNMIKRIDPQFNIANYIDNFPIRDLKGVWKIDADSDQIHRLMDSENFNPEDLSRFTGLDKDHVVRYVANEGASGAHNFPPELLKHPEVRQALLDPSRLETSSDPYDDIKKTASCLKNDLSYDEARDFVQGALDRDIISPKQVARLFPQSHEQDRSHNYVRAIFDHAVKNGSNFPSLSVYNYEDIGRLAAEALKEGQWSDKERKYLINHAIKNGQIEAVSGEELSKHVQAIKDSGGDLSELRGPLEDAIDKGKIKNETLDSLRPVLSNDPQSVRWWVPLYAKTPNANFTAEEAKRFLENASFVNQIPLNLFKDISRQDAEQMIGFKGRAHSQVMLLWHATNSGNEKLPKDQYDDAMRTADNPIELSRMLRQDGRFRDIFDSEEDFEHAVNLPSTNRTDLFDIFTHPMASSKFISELAKKHGHDSDRTHDTDFGGGYQTLDGNYVHYTDASRLDRMVNLSDSSQTVMSGYGLPTKVKVGSAALRQLRDHLEKEGRTMRPEELPKDRTWNSIVKEIRDRKGNVNYVADWTPLRDASGKLSHDKVSDYIDSMPETSLNIVDDRIWDHPLQNHTNKPHSILMHNITPETADKLKSEGLWDSFIHMGNHKDHNPAHPSSPWTLGWTRYHIDHRNKQIFIEEHQSDMSSYFRDHMGGTELDDKQKENMQRAYGMVFGEAHPSELMHESAMQYFRDKGLHGYEVQIHSVPSKAKMTLDEGRDPPAHFKHTYEKTPKKAGAVPAKYGSMKMQDSKGEINGIGEGKLFDEPTYSHRVRKFEDILLDIAKGEW